MLYYKICCFDFSLSLFFDRTFCLGWESEKPVFEKRKFEPACYFGYEPRGERYWDFQVRSLFYCLVRRRN